ncbi:bifunctional molybdenum cofactor biosynthesis protein MoaC/MoaB [Parapedobacter sp. DT-150]|uniref:bifunctional molybdenum cofactor biosynthesis protein MoaC/MoaB n=1 Tax=Parapedobacter sp. DT-150 TaxID=3396162 RepID=UPI003F1947E4
MVDITHKISSLRSAVAVATVSVSKPETMEAVNNRTVPKGDVLEYSRAAGLLAIKKTSDVIPDCHPLPIEFATITYEVMAMTIVIRVTVRTIYKTGVEVEAMHGAAITALTMYDMLKPIDPAVEITQIRLDAKSGGKSAYADQATDGLRCAVVVCSDSVSAGKKQDAAGKTVVQKLGQYGLEVAHYAVIPDELEAIQGTARELSDAGYQLVIFTGGTGLSPRDVTPEAIAPLLDREIPGIMEAARAYGQQRTPYAMLSRGVAGFMGHTLVLTLPGSTRGAAETMDALFPYIIHIFRVAGGMRHDHV